MQTFNDFYLIFVFFILLFFIYLRYSLKNKRITSILKNVPGPQKSYPLIGNLNMIWFNSCSKQINEMIQLNFGLAKVFNENGLFKFKLGPNYAVMIFRADLAEDFLKNNSNLVKPFEYQIFYDWLHKGLLINDNVVLWKQRRKLLTPAFHFKIIEDFLPIINEKSNDLVKNLDCLTQSKAFDICPLVFSCALDIICETTLGYQLNSQKKQNSEYIGAVHRMADHFYVRLERPWLWPDITFYLTKTGKQFKNDVKILHRLSRSVIDERKQTVLENNKIDIDLNNKRKRLAFLDLLLDLHLKDNSLSLDDIQEEVDTFMFAGHDTSASCLSWTIQLIGSHPDVQQRIHEELDSILTKDQDITIEQIKQMVYLDAVIKESMRLFPPVPLIIRKVTEDIKVGDYVIPKGVSLYVLISVLHMDPNIFPEPLLFKPERFLTENLSDDRSPFIYIPFSAGSRNCIGQKFAINEIKVVLSKILLNFELKSLKNITDILVLHSIVTKPVNCIEISIKKRK